MQHSLESQARVWCWPLIPDWGSHSCVAEDSSLLQCYAVLLDEYIMTFRRSVMPSFVWSNKTGTISMQKVKANLHAHSSSGTSQCLSLYLHIPCSLTLQWCWDLNSNYYPGLRSFKLTVCLDAFTSVPRYSAVRPTAREELKVCTVHWTWCCRVNCTPIPAITQKTHPMHIIATPNIPHPILSTPWSTIPT